MKPRASDTDQRGKTLNDLGIALQTLGQRESDTQRLEEAVVAYRAALEEYTQDRVPLGWAMTQHNLSLAKMALADHSTTVDPQPHLEAALEHVNAALDIFDVNQTPFNHEKATTLREQLLTRLASND